MVVFLFLLLLKKYATKLLESSLKVLIYWGARVATQSLASFLSVEGNYRQILASGAICNLSESSKVCRLSNGSVTPSYTSIIAYLKPFSKGIAMISRANGPFSKTIYLHLSFLLDNVLSIFWVIISLILHSKSAIGRETCGYVTS